MTFQRFSFALAFVASASCSTPTVGVPVDAGPEVADVEGKDVFIGTGNLILRWTVRGMPASTGCAAAGAVSVRFPANFVQFPGDLTVPCAQGEHRIMGTTASVAAIHAELLDSAGMVIHAYDVDANVMAGMDNEAAIRFEPAGRLQVRWTINGASPTTECANVNAMGVRVEAQRSRSPMDRVCPGNSVTFSNLQVGPTRVTATLVFNNRDQSSVRMMGEGDVPSGGLGTVNLDFEAPVVTRDE